MAAVVPTLECRLINASIAAYSIEDHTIDPPPGGWEKIGVRPETVTVFTGGNEQIDAGYVAGTVDGWVFVVFRGTLPPFEGKFWKWIDDWLNDLRIEPTTWTVDGRPFGQVEAGFASAVLDVWPQVVTALRRFKLESMKGIIATGHSKGGAASFLAASLLKGQDFKDVPVAVRCFAAPLIADRTFRTNYDLLFRVGELTVRYQNEYDAVPFLPIWPFLERLGVAERFWNDDGNNVVITEAIRQRAEANDYVPIGVLRFMKTKCEIEYGQKAESDAWNDLLRAVEDPMMWPRIVEAHEAGGRYLTCVCT
jgi:hypothetical protein